MTAALQRLEVRVLTLDISGNSDQRCNLAESIPNFLRTPISCVFHVAGLAHLVADSQADADRFLSVNLGGTSNLLAGLERLDRVPDVFVMVSTVAVYGRDSGFLLEENTETLAQDPYGKSKRLAEDLVLQWCREREVRCGIARLPLLVGRDAPGNFGAMVRAIRAGWYLSVGNGETRRSMVLVEDAAAGLILIASAGGIYHLTDGEHPRLRDLELALCAVLGRRWVPRVPYRLGALLAKLGDGFGFITGRPAPFNSRRFGILNATLTFSDKKARSELGWQPQPVLAALPKVLAH